MDSINLASLSPAVSVRVRCDIPTATEQHKGEKIVTLPDGRQFIKHYVTAANSHARRTWEWILAPHVPASPLEGPLFVRAVFAYPYISTDRKKLTKAGAIIWKVTRPDMDNIEKGLWDSVTRLHIWKDDEQIVLKVVGKVRAPTPGLSLDIYRLPDHVAALTPSAQLALADQLPLFNTLTTNIP